jgi:hypothetical protein
VTVWQKHTHNRKKNKYCIVMQFIMCVSFDSIKTINLKPWRRKSHGWTQLDPFNYVHVSHPVCFLVDFPPWNYRSLTTLILSIIIRFSLFHHPPRRLFLPSVCLSRFFPSVHILPPPPHPPPSHPGDLVNVP